jgi:hypothetical protein
MKNSQQVNEIIHHEEFQKLESAWRGLSYLVNNTETDEMLKIRFMSISKPELGRVLKRYKGVGWDQSPIFKKSTKKSTVSSVANRLAAWWRLLFRSQSAGCGTAGRNGAHRRGGALSVYYRHRTECDADGILAGAGEPARPDQNLPEHRVRRLAFAA